VHLADIGEFQIIAQRRGERVAGDDLALVVLGLGRGIAQTMCSSASTLAIGA